MAVSVLAMIDRDRQLPRVGQGSYGEAVGFGVRPEWPLGLASAPLPIAVPPVRSEVLRAYGYSDETIW